MCGSRVTAPTASIETPAALAAVAFLSVHIFGIRMRGLGVYLNGYPEAESGSAAIERFV
jgi:F0F1-type ATP synthase membrane subunit a